MYIEHVMRGLQKLNTGGLFNHCIFYSIIGSIMSEIPTDRSHLSAIHKL